MVIVWTRDAVIYTRQFVLCARTDRTNYAKCVISAGNWSYQAITPVNYNYGADRHHVDAVVPCRGAHFDALRQCRYPGR